MSLSNPKWPRYIAASVNSYVKAALPAGAQIYFEGAEIDTQLSGPLFYEVRTGKYKYTEYLKTQWYIDFVLNIAVNIKKSTTDIYAEEDAVGNALSIFDDFQLFGYDMGVTNPPFLCCLQMRQPPKIVNYGEISLGSTGPIRVMCQSIQTTFRGELNYGSD